jgi:hypothetical protein
MAHLPAIPENAHPARNQAPATPAGIPDTGRHFVTYRRALPMRGRGLGKPAFGNASVPDIRPNGSGTPNVSKELRDAARKALPSLDLNN